MSRFLRPLSFTEGISLLILLFIAMPIKYMLGYPQAVRVVGMIHGLLFLFLVITILSVAKREKWNSALLIFALISSSVPFGMIALDKKLKPEGK